MKRPVRPRERAAWDVRRDRAGRTGSGALDLNPRWTVLRVPRRGNTVLLCDETDQSGTAAAVKALGVPSGGSRRSPICALLWACAAIGADAAGRSPRGQDSAALRALAADISDLVQEKFLAAPGARRDAARVTFREIAGPVAAFLLTSPNG